MLFEISGKKEDIEAINKAMQEFVNDFEDSYKESLKKALESKKASAFGLTKRIENMMPSEVLCFTRIEKGKVLLTNSLPDSSIAKYTGQYKKMIKGVQGFLEWKGFKEIKVKQKKHKVD